MCWLFKLLRKKKPSGATPRLVGCFVIKANGITYRTTQMKIALLDDQNTSLIFGDIAGNKAPSGTIVNWTQTDSTIVSLTPDAETTTVAITTTGKLGTTTVTGTDSTSGATVTADITVGFDDAAPALSQGPVTTRSQDPAPAATTTDAPAPATQTADTSTADAAAQAAA